MRPACTRVAWPRRHELPRTPRQAPVVRGSGSTAIELSELRQDRSADFSPLPAVLAGLERGGLKSALLNSMAVPSLREREPRPSRSGSRRLWFVLREANGSPPPQYALSVALFSSPSPPPKEARVGERRLNRRVMFGLPTPQPSPRSSLAGRGRHSSNTLNTYTLHASE